MRALREQIARVAQHNAHTLFTGEPGSGRELFARFLANQSAQARGPFVAVMGGDLSDENAQRELLGDGTEPGALRTRRGRNSVHPGARRARRSSAASAAERAGAGQLSHHGPNLGPTFRVPRLEQRVSVVRAQRHAAARAPFALERRRHPRAAAARIPRGRAGAAPPSRRPARRHGRAAVSALQRRGAESAAQLSVAAQRARVAEHGQAPADPRRRPRKFP